MRDAVSAAAIALTFAAGLGLLFGCGLREPELMDDAIGVAKAAAWLLLFAAFDKFLERIDP